MVGTAWGPLGVGLPLDRGREGEDGAAEEIASAGAFDCKDSGRCRMVIGSCGEAEDTGADGFATAPLLTRELCCTGRAPRAGKLLTSMSGTGFVFSSFTFGKVLVIILKAEDFLCAGGLTGCCPDIVGWLLLTREI